MISKGTVNKGMYAANASVAPFAHAAPATEAGTPMCVAAVSTALGIDSVTLNAGTTSGILMGTDLHVMHANGIAAHLTVTQVHANHATALITHLAQPIQPGSPVRAA